MTTSQLPARKRRIERAKATLPGVKQQAGRPGRPASEQKLGGTLHRLDSLKALTSIEVVTALGVRPQKGG